MNKNKTVTLRGKVTNNQSLDQFPIIVEMLNNYVRSYDIFISREIVQVERNDLIEVTGTPGIDGLSNRIKANSVKIIGHEAPQFHF